jgi:hypothetical protein
VISRGYEAAKAGTVLAIWEGMSNTETAATKTEWVAVLHGGTGTVKIAYRNPAALAEGLKEQTSEGWMVARVYERDRQTYQD